MRSKTGMAQKHLLPALFILAIAAGAALAARPAQEPAEKTDKSQQPAAASPAKPRATDVLVSPDEDYRIGPRDVVDVTVEKAPELSGTWNVTAKGTFLMPYVGRVVAVNKTPEELAAFIADKLRGEYLKNPRVRVVVKQYNSRSFFIQGAVRTPGVYQVEGRASLLKLIILAGGLGDNHGSTAFIIREIKAEPGADSSSPQDGGASPTNASAAAASDEKYELIKVNINGLLKGNFDQNMMIEPGDIVNIPQADLFFVAGEVRSPGSFTLKEGTTLQQAISLAQGMTFKAAPSRAVIFREEPGTGKRTAIKVDVAAVMGGKKEDIQIMANDVIIVPDSRMKAVTGALLTAFGMHAVIRGLPPY